MKGVYEVVAQDKEPSDLKSIVSNSTDMSKILLNTNNIEILLENAESRAHDRKKWPEKFNRFPATVVKKILIDE